MDTSNPYSEDEKLSSLGRFLEAFETEHGAISPEDIAEASRRTRARAVIVRPRQV
jgi:hypothetical protein